MSIGNVIFCRASGKLGYISEEHANEAARRIANQHHCYLRSYLCECGWWHITRRHHNRRRHSA